MKHPLEFSRVFPSGLISLILLLPLPYPGLAQTSPAAWASVGETSTPRPDYSQPRYWMIAPDNPRAHPVDVLFFHPTTLKDSNYVDPVSGATLSAPLDPSKPQIWNQPIAAAIQESQPEPFVG